MVYLQLHKGYHLPGKPGRKWSQQKAGPFEIAERVGALAYRLKLPDHWRMHDVVHVGQLTEAASDPYRRLGNDMPEVVEGTKDQWEIERLTKRRTIRRQGKTSLQYLVRWKGHSAADDKWLERRELIWTAEELVRQYDQRYPLSRTDKTKLGYGDTSTELLPPNAQTKTNIEVRLPHRK